MVSGDTKPRRKMQENTAMLKAALESRKEVQLVDEFHLKLPDVSSHRYHVTTDGEVRCIVLIENYCNRNWF